MKKVSILLSVLLLLSFTALIGCKDKTAKRTSYDIEITFDDRTLVGTEKVNYFNDTETAISELKFNLYGNAYRKGAKFSPVSPSHTAQSYPDGVSFGDMQINGVKYRETELEYEICGEDMNILSVTLIDEVFPEENVEISIDFTLTLANVISRTGINKHTVNLANFYPILCARDDDGFYECVYYSTGDPFYSDCADYKVKITVDSDYSIASSGREITSEINGEKQIVTYQIQNARSFTFVLSDKFNKLTAETDGVEINYYYYQDVEPNVSLEYAVKSMNFFEETFGEYPYPTYSVVQTKFVQGGMEFPGLVMISDGLDIRSYGEVIVHETAHQWWQTAVGNNEIEYGFLDEGLAEYSVVLFYENYSEYGLSRETLVKSAEDTFKVFCTVSDKVFGKVDTSMLRSLKDFDTEYEYVNMAYIKPCIMYDTLRTTLGDMRFFNGLKKYYQNYKFKNAKPHDLVGAFEKVGADSNGYFESFFDGTAII